MNFYLQALLGFEVDFAYFYLERDERKVPSAREIALDRTGGAIARSRAEVLANFHRQNPTRLPQQARLGIEVAFAYLEECLSCSCLLVASIYQCDPSRQNVTG